MAKFLILTAIVFLYGVQSAGAQTSASTSLEFQQDWVYQLLFKDNRNILANTRDTLSSWQAQDPHRAPEFFVKRSRDRGQRIDFVTGQTQRYVQKRLTDKLKEYEHRYLHGLLETDEQGELMIGRTQLGDPTRPEQRSWELRTYIKGQGGKLLLRRGNLNFFGQRKKGETLFGWGDKFEELGLDAQILYYTSNSKTQATLHKSLPLAGFSARTMILSPLPTESSTESSGQSEGKLELLYHNQF